ncbi:docking domain of Afi1 for Arf3 in vesicle trafficking-domain-containing protein [Sphaerosporella brunnea]|uniref:Docking domain of Afi1 for Arf3 in vesicle trafficking-domain-containing protein n=1 Tax=Sphaerosporella brunnea TaxID=1250544 RepID=A0A5J5F0G0_9PEZI|nr:docking domain of Afi1 for Arf3 in vesicle trafficking-domain-containing protein [Sphaerosporella brunnea]
MSGAEASIRTVSSSAGTAGSRNSIGSARSVGVVGGNAAANQQHVDYILVAQFSIDEGSIMEHQYPNPISGDEHMLAELMLPDGAHTRDQDWTIFFLHKDAEASEEPLEPGTQAPLIYVLNLVITKHDKGAKRGAICKAMAICTRHSFLHIYKPLLLFALEDYFKNPSVDILKKLFTSVNSMDLSAMPRLSIFERQILAASDNKEMFSEKFEEMAQTTMAAHMRSPSVTAVPGESDGEKKPTTYINLGPGRNKFMNGKIAISRDSHEFETKVVYNGIPVPIRVPVAVLPETVGDFSLIQLITTFAAPHALHPQPFPLHPHLTTNGPYTHPVIVLMNGLLTEKRIIFLSHDRPSGEVANHVLAACALASGGTLRGFSRHAFPYTDLSKVEELLQVPGFIAGVKNPAFAHHPSWWDILCNIDTGRIKISTEIKQPPPSENSALFAAASTVSGGSFDTGDNLFMEDVVHCISSRFGEKAVRAKMRDWIIRFTHMAAAFEEMVHGASALWIGHEENHVLRGHGHVWPDEQSKHRDLAANMSRIEGWRTTRSYHAYVQDVQSSYVAKPIKIMDLNHQMDRLRTLKLSPEEAGKIYQAVKEYVNDYEEINQLLCALPENQGGLFPIAVGLFHPSQKVRFAIVELLERISVHMAGRHFFGSLNRFQKLAFIRLQQEKLNASESPVAANGLTMSGLNLAERT